MGAVKASTLRLIVSATTAAAVKALRQTATAMDQVTAAEARSTKAHKTSMTATGLALRNGLRFGNQLQWTGRQLEYNFTLPVIAAGVATTKWALDNEKAMVRVRKVYGDLSMPIKTFNNETAALERSFTALSNFYGQSKAAVTGIAADWAAAGASGLALAKATELTLQAMVLGEMDAQKATQALISIQGQYQLSTKDLADTLAEMNIIENQTGISMAGLIEGFVRTAGVARSAGISTRELGAMLAALVPAAGSAANAGNALKTIISRLLVPTKEARQVLKLMNINVGDVSWQSATAARRLEILAEKFKGLNAGQRAAVSSTIASRWQLNKFDVLMRSLVDSNGFYVKALDATSDRTAYLKQAQKELNIVLNSNPQKLKQMGVILQNSATKIIQPLIPIIIMLAAKVAELADKFSNLPPEVQKAVGFFVLFIAATGPIVRYLGSLSTLLFTFGKGLHFILTPFTNFLKGMRALAIFPFAKIAMGIQGIGKALIGGLLKFKIPGFIIIEFKRLFVSLMILARAAGQGIIAWFLLPFKGGATRFMAAMMLFSKGFLGATLNLTRMALFAGTQTILALVAGLVTGLRKLPMILLRFLVGPWGLAISAVFAILYTFRDQLGILFSRVRDSLLGPWNSAMQGLVGTAGFFQKFVQFLKNIFWSLPVEIQHAMMAVVQVIQAAAMAVYGWFQYLNPFAHHSPSLVENVTKGMAVIQQQFASLSNIKGSIDTAYASIKRLKDVTQGLSSSLNAQDNKDKLAALAKVDPGAIGAFKNLLAIQSSLQARLDAMDPLIRRQQQAVDALSASLDRLNAKLQTEQDKLDALTATAQKYEDVISNAQSTISDLASAPLVGMQKMEDQIFANDQAQKKLQLQMMKMQDAGQTYDDIAGKLSSINGEMEKLQSTQTDLRSRGAGSDILKFYDEEKKKLGDQAKGLQSQSNEYTKLSNALDDLQRKAQMLDLEKSLKFDPLTHQIEKLANTEKELTFSQIVNGIKNAKNVIAQYTPKLNEANAAIAKQQGVVDRLTAAQKTLQATYDKQNDSLSRMKDAYQSVSDTLSAVGSALDDISQKVDSAASKAAAKKAKKGKKGEALTPGAQAFLEAGKGKGFPVPGGSGNIGREGGPGDQSKLIDDFTKELQGRLEKSFGKIDILAPIKKKFAEFKAWWDKNIAPAWAPIKTYFMNLFAGIDWSSSFGPDSGLGKAFAWLKGVVFGIGTFFVQAWGVIKDLFRGDFPAMFTEIGSALKDAFKDLLPALKDLGLSLKDVLPILGMVAKIGFGALLVVIKVVVSFLKNVLPPIIRMVGGILKGLIKIFSGFIDIIVGIFTGDPKKIIGGFAKIFEGLGTIIWRALQGVVEIVVGVFRSMFEIVLGVVGAGIGMIFGRDSKWYKAWQKISDDSKNAFDSIVAHVKGFFKAVGRWFKKVYDGVVGWFQKMFDKLVGHSIVPDLIKAILKCFKDLVTWLVKPLRDTYDKVVKTFNDLWNWVKNTWSKSWNKVKDVLTKPITDFKNWWAARWVDLKNGFNYVWSWVSATWNKTWNKVKTVISKPITDFVAWFKLRWVDIKTGFNSIWTWVSGTWNKTWNKVKDTITKPITDAKTALSNIFTGKRGIASVFSTAVSAIGRAWDGIKAVAKAPVHFVIDTVINKGIIGAYNSFVRKLFGKNTKLQVGPFPLPFREGGKIPGGPGRGTGVQDKVLGLDRRGIPTARVSPNEFVVNERQTRKYEPILEAINAGRYHLPGYAEGGAIRPSRGWPTRSHRVNPSYPGHSGVDFFGRDGDPIFAAMAGKINYVGAGRGYGNAIFERGLDGLMEIYGHTSRQYVRAGQKVNLGQLLGLVGHSGNVRPRGPAGAHLHFEIARYGTASAANRGYTFGWLNGAVNAGKGGGTPPPGQFGPGPGQFAPSGPDWNQEYSKLANKLDAFTNRFQSNSESRWEKMVHKWPDVVVTALKRKAKELIKFHGAGTAGTRMGWSLAGEGGPELIGRGAGSKVLSSRSSAGALGGAFGDAVSRAFTAGMSLAVPRMEQAVASNVGTAMGRVASRYAPSTEERSGSNGTGGNVTNIRIDHLEVDVKGADPKVFIDNLVAVAKG